MQRIANLFIYLSSEEMGDFRYKSKSYMEYVGCEDHCHSTGHDLESPEETTMHGMAIVGHTTGHTSYYCLCDVVPEDF